MARAATADTLSRADSGVEMTTGWVTYPRMGSIKPSRAEERAMDDIVGGRTISLNSHIHAQAKEA